MDIFTSHPHWPNVLEVCKKLQDHGFKAWLAGGCVRDYFLNTPPKDFDIATDALPEKVQELFSNSLDIGKQFGIIMVPFDSFQIEVATFRSDGEYKNGRHPVNVTFATPQEDAERRDFTVNAMFFDPLTDKLHDYVEGQRDLKLKVLRAVGNPYKRFEEDKLRILRAIRFSAQLGFEIESNTLSAISKYAPQIHMVSMERIQQELKKLFESKELSRGLGYLKTSTLYKELLRGLAGGVDLDEVYSKSLDFLRTKDTFELNGIERLFLFLYPFYKAPVGLEVIEEWLSSMKFPKFTIKKLLNLFDKTRWIKNINKKSLGERILTSHSVNSDSFKKVYKILVSEGFEDKDKLQAYNEAHALYETLPKPLVNGHDLMGLGYAPGCDMGDNLQKIYFYQLEKKIQNKEVLIEWAQKQNF